MADEVNEVKKDIEEKPDKKKRGLEGMDDHELLLDLAKEQRRTSRYTKLIGVSCVGICVAVCISLAVIVPKVLSTLSNVNKTVDSAYTVEENASNMIVSAQESLDGIDVMIENVDSVVVDNTESVTEALAKLNDVDFDTLNQSIQDLHSVIEPLAKMFSH